MKPGQLAWTRWWVNGYYMSSGSRLVILIEHQSGTTGSSGCWLIQDPVTGVTWINFVDEMKVV